jgi:hypothetical protein
MNYVIEDCKVQQLKPSEKALKRNGHLPKDLRKKKIQTDQSLLRTTSHLNYSSGPTIQTVPDGNFLFNR